ncbi:MAG: N-acetylmuramoyl-L-alanine amidase [Chitinophagaceae bacterium]|nr:N-acetylmuramoyl-L-alanine amidase [Chitinophagaceae bacterium]
MKRNIKYIVVHCTATPPEAKVENIVRYWKEQLGWKNPGYHYIIKRNGEIVSLLSEDLVSNGVKNYNQQSVHISYIGGIDKNNKPVDNRTPEQKKAMFNKLVALSEKYPEAQIKGHRDFPGVIKACPSFDVRTWLKDYIPEGVT